MIPRNSPLPILCRIGELSRRQLAITRIGNALILRDAFALLTR